MRRLLALSVVAVGALTLAGAALAPAGAGGPQVGVAPLTIEKEVDGLVPEDAEFTVTVECEGAIIFNNGGPFLASVEIDFDEEGDPDDPNTILFGSPGTCTVTETEDGDAEDVSYECEGQIASGGTPCLSGGPQEDPIQVVIESSAQSATVTVENEFPDPEPPAPVPAAQPVTASPTFTG